MKKYNIQLLINLQMNKCYWKGLDSDSSPKMIDYGVMQIGHEYFNAIFVEEMIITENHQPD